MQVVDIHRISCHNCTNCFMSANRPVCSKLDFAIVGSDTKCSKFEPNVLVERILGNMSTFSFVEVERRGQSNIEEIEVEVLELQEV